MTVTTEKPKKRASKKTNGSVSETRIIEINKPSFNVSRVVVRQKEGEPGLITHRLDSEKLRAYTPDGQPKKNKKDAIRDPEQEILSCFHVINPELPDYAAGKYGYPSVGFKKSSVIAMGRFLKSIPQTEAWGLYHVMGQLVRIDFEAINSREDVTRDSGMTRAPRLTYRPEFMEWSAELYVRYMNELISIEQIADILDLAGSTVGVGDWRVDKKGSHGQFEVDHVDPVVEQHEVELFKATDGNVMDAGIE